MPVKISPYALGATLYMPAIRHDILEIIHGEKLSGLKSMVICFEDALAESQLEEAFENFTQLATQIKLSIKKPLVFIRPRNFDIAIRLIKHCDLSKIDGMVLPKFTLDSLPIWQEILEDTHLYWLPTLETQDVFSYLEMQKLADSLSTFKDKNKILALRIGGNDLMSVLGLRRPRDMTIYDTPLGYVIKMLVAVFGSTGFALTAPVCELIENLDILELELKSDIAHGLVGKTAIHPNQIPIIQDAWKVKASEFAEAQAIMNAQKAVFQMDGAMCEPATHTTWARNLLERYGAYGLLPNKVQEFMTKHN
ncbi:HpcH/HpaI aldolase/citrate lyase family protein [Thorsellia anophelis]|uniref:Citrate lyase beta subunit n=1 Tax=Thorsellia anophelis DSM 18579 TaxID=1123402 RepID=A0A1I0EPI4_9GAMM|nr:HpcH/HpaI aldolase/citrate lyase family protein [Thorsellia anophelis]SET46939.1 Citrate lyase beta subunit [Thorsellia anophelis DSM 18579]